MCKSKIHRAVLTDAEYDESELGPNVAPKLVFVDEKNRIKR